jgi:hypothetical protein
MELLGDVDHVEYCFGLAEFCFGLFGDNVSVSIRDVQGLRQTYHKP